MGSCLCFQNMLGAEGDGFKISMAAFDRTRPPVRLAVSCAIYYVFIMLNFMYSCIQFYVN